jgi:hypothetical protein
MLRGLLYMYIDGVELLSHIGVRASLRSRNRYKAAFLNLFVSAHNVQTVIEFGCGDGANLQLYKIPRFVGFRERTLIHSFTYFCL